MTTPLTVHGQRATNMQVQPRLELSRETRAETYGAKAQSKLTQLARMCPLNSLGSPKLGHKCAHPARSWTVNLPRPLAASLLAAIHSGDPDMCH